MDPYSSCFCGSGKKLKWCCQDIYVEVNQAFEKENGKQHEAARRLMQGVIDKNPGNPQAWCFHSQLMTAQGNPEEAEKSVEKALEIRNDHPFALLLQAGFRMQEGELEGARLLARRSAESYDPQAKDYLAEAYGIIQEAEMRRNNPVAARAALQIMIRCAPSEEKLRALMEGVFGEDGLYPEVAIRDYSLSPPADAEGEARKKWDEALSRAVTSRLGSLSKSFQDLARNNPEDTAAWRNVGLTQAWLGNNGEALDALEKYIELETDENKAAECAALSQVLLQGLGMQNRADYKAQQVHFQITDVQPVGEWLRALAENQRLIPMKEEENAPFKAIILEPVQEGLLTSSATPEPTDHRVVAQVSIYNDHLSIWSLDESQLEKAIQGFQEAVGEKANQIGTAVVPAGWGDISAEGIALSMNKSEGDGKEELEKNLSDFYEGKWIHQPLVFLGGNAPMEAVGHDIYRKKLRGLILFLEQCSKQSFARVYDFDRLRRKVGLLDGSGSEDSNGTDINSMSPAELSSLNLAEMNEDELLIAYQASQRLQARELQQRFGEALVGVPEPQEGDRYPIFSFLIDHALSEKPDEAIDLVDAGEKHDCEHNDGKRRNDFELRRGQVHIKRKEADEAHNVFRRLIERSPDNLDYHVKATNGMLSLGQKDRTIEFAEAGLAEARKQKEGDAEGELMELMEAAKRL